MFTYNSGNICLYKARQCLYSTRPDSACRAQGQTVPVNNMAKQCLYSTRLDGDCTAQGQTVPVQHKVRQCLYSTRPDSACTAQGQIVPVQHKGRQCLYSTRSDMTVQHKVRQCLYSKRPSHDAFQFPYYFLNRWSQRTAFKQIHKLCAIGRSVFRAY